MSYTEYKDMFEHAQSRGKYQMFIVDIKDSKKISAERMQKINLDMCDRFERICDRIENELQVLHINDMSIYNNHRYFKLGDLWGICTEAGFNKSVEKIIKEELAGCGVEYHFETGFYDTDDWAMGGKEYYFGYCIQELENKHKVKERKLNYFFDEER